MILSTGLSEWSKRYISLAKEVSTWSKDPSRKIGAVAVGEYSGNYQQGYQAVAIGTYAGYSDQGWSAVAIGKNAGEYNQGSVATAVGPSAGGAGGSGVVILWYTGSQKGSGGTVTSSGGVTYHTFTTSGTYTG